MHTKVTLPAHRAPRSHIGKTHINKMAQFKIAPPLRAWSILAMVAMAFLTGCANQEAQLVGQWKADASKMHIPAGKTPQEKMGAQMAQQMLANMTLDLKKDKTYAMNMMLAMEGNWKIENNAVVLEMNKMGGMDMSKLPKGSQKSKPLILNIGSGNKTLTLQSPGEGKNPMGDLVFVKQ